MENFRDTNKSWEMLTSGPIHFFLFFFIVFAFRHR